MGGKINSLGPTSTPRQIDFHLLWLLEPTRAYKLYAEESMARLDRRADSVALNSSTDR